MASLPSGQGSDRAGSSAVSSAISAVTVYLDRAQVTRTATTHLQPGLHRLTFCGLPAEIEEGSLRLALNGPARLESLQSQPTFLAQHQEQAIRELEQTVAALRDRSGEQKDLIITLEKALGFLDSVQAKREDDISSELGRSTGTGPNIEEYRTTLAFLIDQRIILAKRMRDARIAIEEIGPSLTANEAALGHLRESSRLEQKEVIA